MKTSERRYVLIVIISLRFQAALLLIPIGFSVVFVSYDHNWDIFPACQLNACKQKWLNYSGRTEIVFLWNDGIRWRSESSQESFGCSTSDN